MASILPEMQTFLYALYGMDSQILQSEEKLPIYSVPGKGISITTDAYSGCRVTVLNTVKHDKSLVKATLKWLVQELSQTRTCRYVAVDIQLPAKANVTAMLPKCFKVGNADSNLIHDDHGKCLTYWTWTDLEHTCTIPTLGPTHIYGASVLLIDRCAQKVFLVRTKDRNVWEGPGGGDDPFIDERLCDTASRETQEEGGFAEMPVFRKDAVVIGQMELPLRKFARCIHQFWVCFADGMSKQEFSPQAGEILEAGWFDIDLVLKAEKVKGKMGEFSLSPDIKPSLLAARSGHGLQRSFEDADGRRVFYFCDGLENRNPDHPSSDSSLRHLHPN